MQVGQWVAEWLTRGYARIIDLSGVSREEDYEAFGEQERVFWIDASSWPVSGQYTLFGTILLNQSKLEKAPEDVKDYIFLHEVGHSKLPTLLSLVSVLVRIPLVFFAILGIPVLVIQWIIYAFSGPPIGQLMTFSAAYLLVALLVVVPLVVVWQLDEAYAELYVVSKIGKEAYQRCSDKMEEYSDRGLFARLLRKLFYPSPDLVLWLANRQRG